MLLPRASLAESPIAQRAELAAGLTTSSADTESDVTMSVLLDLRAAEGARDDGIVANAAADAAADAAGGPGLGASNSCTPMSSSAVDTGATSSGTVPVSLTAREVQMLVLLRTMTTSDDDEEAVHQAAVVERQSQEVGLLEERATRAEDPRLRI